MTSPDDGQRDDPPKGTPDGPVEPDEPFDEDAAWRLIVENYGERPEMGDYSAADEPPPTRSVAPPVTPPVAPPSAPTFDRSYLDAVEARRAAEDARAAARHEDEHFVPPEPPPIPRGTPARRLAWVGLFGPPLLMLLAVVLGWTFAPWFSMMLVAAFVGGFVFLIATMPRDSGDGGGDGAVV